MGIKMELIVLFILGVSWACDSRELGIIVKPLAGATDSGSLTSHGKKENVCTLCEEFATKARNYFSSEKTQEAILDILQMSCSKMHSFKQECLKLVDYYVPFFFKEISSVKPADFCQKVDLCQQVVFISHHLGNESCEFCQNTVAEALLKLKDPETEMELLKMFLKGCDSVKGYEKQCKRMVFEYGPIILANAEHLLETNDVCTMLHACDSRKSNTKETSAGEAILFASS